MLDFASHEVADPNKGDAILNIVSGLNNSVVDEVAFNDQFIQSPALPAFGVS